MPMKISLAVFAMTLAAIPALAAEPDGLILPPGFHANIVADGLQGVRHLAFGSSGNLYVSVNVVRGQPPPALSRCILTPTTRPPRRSILAPSMAARHPRL